jgi:hypothetical protein
MPLVPPNNSTSRDGTAMGEQTPTILGFFDSSAFEVPPKTPPPKGGCCWTL